MYGISSVFKRFKIASSESSSGLLKIEKVDYCLSENGKAHRTLRYEIMNRVDGQARLVVRRGQSFTLNLTLSRNYEAATDEIIFIFFPDGVQKPSYEHDICVLSKVSHSGGVPVGFWKVDIQSSSVNSLRIEVTPAVNSIIGKWRMDIRTHKNKQKGFNNFTKNDYFFILFNPWCSKDEVYLNDEYERQEYVLNDTGLIWRGTAAHMSDSVWMYSQFENDILDCALYLITNIGRVPVSRSNDPITVTRRLSGAINSNDDNGVLIGKWSGDYSDGTSPLNWVGSLKILQTYYKTKKPVKYGQCWVFAGVLTTICRSLGIPCRVVTNFNSAHNTQNNLTMDCYVNENGKIINNEDSKWNFHVWNEVWMKRLDLTPDCHGWQVVDATPQETSENIYQCGPASVNAIKRGELQIPYDHSFIYAEVNADVLIWQLFSNGQRNLLSSDTDQIGQKISTKAVGSNAREDITHTYKYSEKSKEERNVMLKALLECPSELSRPYLSYFNKEFKDLIFNLELGDDILIGQQFSVILAIKNLSNEQMYKISVKLHVETVTYKGHVTKEVKYFVTERCIKPDITEEVRLIVSWDEYGPQLLDQGIFKISCLAEVKDTDFKYVRHYDFRVRKPVIIIELKNDPVVGETLRGTASFINPLPIPLKKGNFVIQSPGLRKQSKFKLMRDVEVSGEAFYQFSMTPKFAGNSAIAIKFHSNELDDIDGCCNFWVNPRSSEILT